VTDAGGVPRRFWPRARPECAHALHHAHVRHHHAHAAGAARRRPARPGAACRPRRCGLQSAGLPPSIGQVQHMRAALYKCTCIVCCQHRSQPASSRVLYMPCLNGRRHHEFTGSADGRGARGRRPGTCTRGRCWCGRCWPAAAHGPRSITARSSTPWPSRAARFRSPPRRLPCLPAAPRRGMLVRG